VLQNKLLVEQTHAKIQEQRLALSRDLHDSLGAHLTLISSVVDGLKLHTANGNELVAHKINALSEFSESSISELKSTLWVLNEEVINMQHLKIKLLNFISAAAEAMEHITFRSTFKVDDNTLLNSKQAVHIYRLVQEIVNNAMKYANASEITITAQQENNTLTLHVNDNGNGFDYELVKEKSYGLQNIISRIKSINGEVAIKSSIGEGTQYTLHINLS
jgi:signal transduction histidine kinase